MKQKKKQFDIGEFLQQRKQELAEKKKQFKEQEL